MVFHTGSANDQRALALLEREMIGWLTTVTDEGQPQTMPIWFLWHNGEATIYGDRRARRNRNIAANPRVTLHLNSNAKGGDVVVIEGEARIDADGPAMADNAPYLAKYADWIRDFMNTPEEMFTIYNSVIRIRPTRGIVIGAV